MWVWLGFGNVFTMCWICAKADQPMLGPSLLSLNLLGAAQGYQINTQAGPVAKDNGRIAFPLLTRRDRIKIFRDSKLAGKDTLHPSSHSECVTPTWNSLLPRGLEICVSYSPCAWALCGKCLSIETREHRLQLHCSSHSLVFNQVYTAGTRGKKGTKKKEEKRVGNRVTG